MHRFRNAIEARGGGVGGEGRGAGVIFMNYCAWTATSAGANLMGEWQRTTRVQP